MPFLLPPRHLLQNASALCRRFHHALPRPVPQLGLPLQFPHEAFLHRKQYLHPLPHESPLPVRRPPFFSLSNESDRTRPTNDPSIDTFRVEYLAGPAFILGLIFNYSYSLTEVFWSFSIFLEAVAILPQLFILQRTGEAETITTHYLAALGAYRGLYIPNWIYRCVISLCLVCALPPALCASDVCCQKPLTGACWAVLDTSSRSLSTQSPSQPVSYRPVYISTFSMYTSPSTLYLSLNPVLSLISPKPPLKPIHRVLQGQKFELPA